jgi:hypothetical protein
MPQAKPAWPSRPAVSGGPQAISELLLAQDQIADDLLKVITEF